MTASTPSRDDVRRRNVRTALAVGSVALVFFLGFIAKMWLQR